MFLRSVVDEARMKRRATVLRQKIREVMKTDRDFVVTPLGERLFGLDVANH